LLLFFLHLHESTHDDLVVDEERAQMIHCVRAVSAQYVRAGYSVALYSTSKLGEIKSECTTLVQ